MEKRRENDSFDELQDFANKLNKIPENRPYYSRSSMFYEGSKKITKKMDNTKKLMNCAIIVGKSDSNN